MRNIVAYILILVIFGFAIWSTLNAGRKLHLAENPRQVAQAEITQRNDITKGFHDNLRGPLGILLTQIVVPGILSSQIFAILVLMALTTTLMTAPLLSLVPQARFAKT